MSPCFSELRNGKRANPHVVAWFMGVAEEEIHLSVLAVGELRRGIERWLRQIVRDHAERILPVDTRVAEHWGRLTAMRSESVIDTLMGATARALDLVLVTRNVKHVAWTGVSYLNPFDPPTAE